MTTPDVSLALFALELEKDYEMILEDGSKLGSSRGARRRYGGLTGRTLDEDAVWEICSRFSSPALPGSLLLPGARKITCGYSRFADD